MTDFMTVNSAANYLNVSESYLNRLRSLGGGPTYVQLGRAVRYRKSDLDLWVTERLRRSVNKMLKHRGEK